MKYGWTWCCVWLKQGSDWRDDEACPAHGHRHQPKDVAQRGAERHTRLTGHDTHFYPDRKN